MISYRKSKKFLDRMIVEGWIEDRFSEQEMFHAGSVRLGQYVTAADTEAPPTKLIDQILKNTETARFDLPKADLRLIKSGAKRTKYVTVFEESGEGVSVSINPIVAHSKSKKGNIEPKLQETVVEYHAKGSVPEMNGVKLPFEILSGLPNKDYFVRVLGDRGCVIAPFDDAFTVYAAIS